jgi:hypothetical protein
MAQIFLGLSDWAGSVFFHTELTRINANFCVNLRQFGANPLKS